MTRLVILTYGASRITYCYLNADTDEEAVRLATERCSQVHGLAPQQYMVFAGSASVHIGPGDVQTLRAAGWTAVKKAEGQS